MPAPERRRYAVPTCKPRLRRLEPATDTGRGILRACDRAALNYVGALATVTVFPDASGGLPRRRGGIRRPSPLSAMFFVQLAETAAEAERLRAVIAACYGLAPARCGGPPLFLVGVPGPTWATPRTRRRP